MYRLTLVKEWNTEELEAYANLVAKGNPDFIEIKVLPLAQVFDYIKEPPAFWLDVWRSQDRCSLQYPTSHTLSFQHGVCLQASYMYLVLPYDAVSFAPAACGRNAPLAASEIPLSNLVSLLH